MIVTDKSHQNLSDYIQILLKKRFNLMEKVIISNDKMRNSGNYIYDHAHLFFVKNFLIKSQYW